MNTTLKEIINEKPTRFINPILQTTAVGACLLILALIPELLDLDNRWEGIEFHSSIEGIGGMMCVILSLFLINEKYFSADYPELFLFAIIFFILGLGNILHSFQEPNKLFIFYHSFAGFFAGIVSLLILFPKLLVRISRQKRAYVVFVGFSIVIYLIFILFPDAVPYMGNEESFSSYAIILNVVAGITFLLLTIKIGVIQNREKSTYDYRYFSLIFIVFSVSYLTFFTSALWDTSWWMWHFYAFLAITLVIYSIISHQKNLILKLSKSQEILINKNKELEQFTYITSHDLQEPLNSILSFSFLLRQNGYDKLDQIGQQSVTIIEQSSNRMKAFITSLLEFSRIGREKEKTEVNIETILDDLKNDLNDLIAKEDATIKYVGEIMTINAYQTDLIKLFQNIVVNAIRYRNAEEAPFVVISSKELQNEYEFTVTDNGIGIEEEYYDKIFEVFRRLHTRDQYEGTGIGLAYCKKIVELHHGRIWLKSKPGKGSKFYFTIAKN